MGGTTLARYSYDAWGKCTITEDTTEVDIATVNPYRYRSYYYDTETALYYLQSRYYDPETGRFLNADEAKLVARQGLPHNLNLYSYCDNDPVNKKDVEGYLGLWVALLIVVGAGIAVGLIDLYATIKTKNFKESIGGGQIMQASVAFLLGFFKGAGAMFFTLLGVQYTPALISGLIAMVLVVYDSRKKLFKGKKLSKNKLIKTFTDSYTSDILNGVLFGDLIKKLASYVKAGKSTETIRKIVEKILEKVIKVP